MEYESTENFILTVNQTEYRWVHNQKYNFRLHKHLIRFVRKQKSSSMDFVNYVRKRFYKNSFISYLL